MTKLFLRGAVLGLVLWAVLPVGAAHATPSISISRGNNQQASGAIEISWTASSSAGIRWAHAEILGSHGPNPSCVDGSPNCSGDSWGGPGDPSFQSEVGSTTYWDTNSKTPYNGSYTFRVTAYDYSPANAESFEQITVLVNNAPQTPSWASGISAGKDGSGRPYVNLSWSYGGTEPDLREFQLARTGPGGARVIWSIFASNPGVNGAQCTRSGGTYSCTDTAFPGTGFGGGYTYTLYALRSSPVGPNACHLDSSGNPYPNGATRPCIARTATSTQTTSLDEPPPPPDGGGGGTTPPPGGGGSNGGPGSSGGVKPGIKPPPGGTTLIGGQRGSAVDNSEFYQGSYEQSLPYQDRTVILPGQKIPFGSKGSSSRVEALADDTAPLGIPLKDRAVILPLAAGLLLFLGAAHVKRLLTDR